MYYQLSDFYKRDVYFVYNIELNKIHRFDLVNCKAIESNDLLIYNIDKIDIYLNDYDILPTFDAPLISAKFKILLENICNKEEIQFINTIIIDKNKNENKNFYILNILNKAEVLDKEKSTYEVDEDDFYTIQKAYYIPNSLGEKSIVRMEEHKSYIIVNEEFKKRCEEAGLKGVEFVEEGHTIYTDI
ncbi:MULTISPECIES: imm11 family protein [Flavobacterium]|uniref:imm11 family protein n=1 Tax=Flavobacterium TaxID=237 RepID=UPI000745CFB2|nr:DUF1629 domain-containing protein [Flavobacterium covae]AMA50403.1 hypothetical protein AWN65_13500 [Flavobacterium covae]MCJ1810526.1 hypothetical protein [Flavobacterium covae]